MTAPAVGLQLYTLRELLAEPGARPELLERVAELGVRAVEPFGLASAARSREETLADARALRAETAAAGLSVPSVHTGIPDPGEAGWFFEALGELGHPIAVVPAPEGLAGFSRTTAFSDPDELARLAERLAALAEVAAGAGARVGYHNHWWEWSELPDGRPAYDVLWERTDPRVVAEVDLYWAQAAGQDPAAVVARHGARAELVHVKDGPAVVETPPQQRPPGTGTVALDAALRAGAATITTAHIEADHVAGDGDPLEYVAQGVAWLAARSG